MSEAMRFSKPERFWCENGTLSGSAQTRNYILRTKFGASASDSASATLRQRKDMQHAAFHRVLGKVLHGVDEAERRRAVARIDFAGDDGAGPAADAGEHRDVLPAIGAAIAHRLADDSRGSVGAPQHFAGLGIE